ncbi:hypothetical protein M9Y10_005088 [Tritrichomonas musculus]|uniref:HECT domain-containing protein n=1 Tax=Tritrichomonas musculus TaxID=1915356 RepID=A0ABR2JK95_9EUKA
MDSIMEFDYYLVETQSGLNQTRFELTPYLFFTQPFFCSNVSTPSSNSAKTCQHLFSNFIYKAIRNIEYQFYSKKCYSKDKEERKRFEKNIISTLANLLTDEEGMTNTFKNQLSNFSFKVLSNQNFLREFSFFYTKKIKKDLRTMPIKRTLFPSYVYSTNSPSHGSFSFNNLRKYENSLFLILQKSSNANKQAGKHKYMYSQDDLINFLKILLKCQMPYSFSLTFILNTLKIFDSFLSSLLPASVQESKEELNQRLFKYFIQLDSKSEEFNLYRLILLIKMQLYMKIHKIHDFLVILLEFIILESDKKEFNFDDDFSFKKISIDSISCFPISRTLFIKDTRKEDILDFSFSVDKKNDFFLTKKGIICNNDTNKTVKFKEEENASIEEMLKRSSQGEAKIAVSKGVIYLLCLRDKMIHKVRVSPDYELDSINQRKRSKFAKYKEFLHKKFLKGIKSTQRFHKKKGKIKNNTSRKNRQNERKKKINLRTEEKFKIETNEELFDSVKIDLDEWPILSIGFNDDYLRIAQLKSDKIVVFTNVDLKWNCRTNFDLNEAFQIEENEIECKQTTEEIVLDRQEKKLLNVLFSNDSMFLLYDDSIIEERMIYSNGKTEFIRKMNSPLIFTSGMSYKIDNEQFLYYLESIECEEEYGITIGKFYLSETRYSLREDFTIQLKYPYLQKLSNIVSNCSQFIMNRKVIKGFTNVDFEQYFDKGFEEDQLEPLLTKKKFELTVFPDEMSTIIQSPPSSIPLFETLKEHIKELKDENLKKFFILLFIKISGANLLYETNQKCYNKKFTDSMNKILRNYRKFIFDLYELYESKNESNEIMIVEAMIFTLTIGGKYLFYPNLYNQLHAFFNQIFRKYSKSNLILRSISPFLFSYPSSLYIIDKDFYNILSKIEEPMNIHSLFLRNIIYIYLEVNFSRKMVFDDFIKFIHPYFEMLFRFIYKCLKKDKILIIFVEQLLSYFFCMEQPNAVFSLTLENSLIGISQNLFNKISQIKGVLESDKEFLDRNHELEKYEVHKEVVVIESDHPYNSEVINVIENNETKKEEKKETRISDMILYSNKKKKKKEKKKKEFIIQDIASVDFGLKANKIYIDIDKKSKISPDDKILFYSKSQLRELKLNGQNKIDLNKYIVIYSNKVRVAIARKIKTSEKVEEKLWGVKMKIIGISFEYPFDWQPNPHLYFYNHFISFLVGVHNVAYESTPLKEVEKKFKLILDEKIIQGIQFEEIINYEKNQKEKENEESLNQDNDNKIIENEKTLNLNQNKESLIQNQVDIDNQNQPNESLNKNQIKDGQNNIKVNKMKLAVMPVRQMSQGLSRGISYDSEKDDSKYEDKKKTEFIFGIIQSNMNPIYKRFLDVLYSKTWKRKYIRLNESKKEILEIEHYFIACLLKQLGLISLCIDFNQTIMRTRNEDLDKIEAPDRLVSLWKKVFSLRRELFYKQQQSKQNKNIDPATKDTFEKYSEEVKQKCKLLLYSVPILKFKDKGNLSNEEVESSAKMIIKFITYEMPLSSVTELISIRRRRLLISKRSIKLMSAFVNAKLLFESSKPIFTLFYGGITYSFRSMRNVIYTKKNCKGVTLNELDEYDNDYSSLTLGIINNVFTQPSIAMISNLGFLKAILFNHKNNKSRIICAKTLITMLLNNENNKTSFKYEINFVLILIVLAIALKTKDKILCDYVVSLISSSKIDIMSINLILTVIPIFNDLGIDVSSVLNENTSLELVAAFNNIPILAKSYFYWLSKLFVKEDQSILTKRHDFIRKVFIGIGQAFVGKSCLFINDSFDPFCHRQVCETMISFIRLLFNSKNDILMSIIHDILKNEIKEIKMDSDEEKIMISIGLFASFGQTLSSLEHDRKLSSSINQDSCITILGYNPTIEEIITSDNKNESNMNSYSNSVFLDNIDLDLTEEEVGNILDLHETLINSQYFKEDQEYEKEINQKEITENVLISTFYSFLPIVMQNKKNAAILLNEENMKRSLSIFNLSKQKVSSNENSILMLSHYLEQAIVSPLYNTKSTAEPFLNGTRFMKMNHGEIIYNNNENDLIKGNINHLSLFLCNRPFDSKMETFYELKVKNIGFRNIFIGFIDLEETDYNRAFGFGSFAMMDIFCRKSQSLSDKIINISDEPMWNSKFPFKEGDLIGCYYTENFVYLTINGKLSEFRLSHKSLKAYSPIIIIDSDEAELEVVRNATIVDFKDDKFDFLNVKNVPSNYFEAKDIKSTTQDGTKMNDFLFLHEDFDENEGEQLIGQFVSFSRAIFIESDLETLEPIGVNLLPFKGNYGIIKDMHELSDNNRYVSKVKVEVYNNLSLSKEVINEELDSRYFKYYKTNFFNLIENRTNTKFGLNSAFNIDDLPDKYKENLNHNSIRNFLKHRTIKENSKSIAIIFIRYLVFILIDYLRYSRSRLLTDEGINTSEAQCIIEALSFSLPTITLFSPSFEAKIDQTTINDYIIFQDEQPKGDHENGNEKAKQFYKIPGLQSCFDLSFKIFLEKSKSFISPHFLNKLLQSCFDNVSSNGMPDILKSLYYMIPCAHKIESISPLPEKVSLKDYVFNYQSKVFGNTRNFVGFIPILLSTLPDKLPCVVCRDKRFRIASDVVSYFTNFTANSTITFSWDYNVRSEKFDENYKMQFGIFMLSKNLPEKLLNGPLGFIQIVFNIIQILDSNELKEDILQKLFTLTMMKNPLTYPFIQAMIASFISENELHDKFVTKSAFDSFSLLSKASPSLCQIEEFPTYQNELPLIFCIYSNLIKIRYAELHHEDDLSSLFDKYYAINKELFSIYDDDESRINYVEGSIVNSNNDRNRNSFSSSSSKKKKDFRLFYLLYFYSILLNNEKCFPYPKFLFYHDRMRQHFGSFRKVITKSEVSCFNVKKGLFEMNIQYRSEKIENDFKMMCSFKLVSLYEKDKASSILKKSVMQFNSKIIIHQLEDDAQIELPQTGEPVEVSFPLEILVCKLGMIELKNGEVFVVDFCPSREQQKEYFIQHYNQLQEEFDEFISIGKYDNELSNKILASIESKKEKESQNERNANSQHFDFGRIFLSSFSNRPFNSSNTSIFRQSAYRANNVFDDFVNNDIFSETFESNSSNVSSTTLNSTNNTSANANSTALSSTNNTSTNASSTALSGTNNTSANASSTALSGTNNTSANASSTALSGTNDTSTNASSTALSGTNNTSANASNTALSGTNDTSTNASSTSLNNNDANASSSGASVSSGINKNATDANKNSDTLSSNSSSDANASKSSEHSSTSFKESPLNTASNSSSDVKFGSAGSSQNSSCIFSISANPSNDAFKLNYINRNAGTNSDSKAGASNASNAGSSSGPSYKFNFNSFTSNAGKNNAFNAGMKDAMSTEGASSNTPLKFSFNSSTNSASTNNEPNAAGSPFKFNFNTSNASNATSPCKISISNSASNASTNSDSNANGPFKFSFNNSASNATNSGSSTNTSNAANTNTNSPFKFSFNNSASNETNSGSSTNTNNTANTSTNSPFKLNYFNSSTSNASNAGNTSTNPNPNLAAASPDASQGKIAAGSANASASNAFSFNFFKSNTNDGKTNSNSAGSNTFSLSSANSNAGTNAGSSDSVSPNLLSKFAPPATSSNTSTNSGFSFNNPTVKLVTTQNDADGAVNSPKPSAFKFGGVTTGFGASKVLDGANDELKFDFFSKDASKSHDSKGGNEGGGAGGASNDSGASKVDKGAESSTKADNASANASSPFKLNYFNSSTNNAGTNSDSNASAGNAANTNTSSPFKLNYFNSSTNNASASSDSSTNTSNAANSTAKVPFKFSFNNSSSNAANTNTSSPFKLNYFNSNTNNASTSSDSNASTSNAANSSANGPFKFSFNNSASNAANSNTNSPFKLNYFNGSTNNASTNSDSNASTSNAANSSANGPFKFSFNNSASNATNSGSSTNTSNAANTSTNSPFKLNYFNGSTSNASTSSGFKFNHTTASTSNASNAGNASTNPNPSSNAGSASASPDNAGSANASTCNAFKFNLFKSTTNDGKANASTTGSSANSSASHNAGSGDSSGAKPNLITNSPIQFEFVPAANSQTGTKGSVSNQSSPFTLNASTSPTTIVTSTSASPSALQSPFSFSVSAGSSQLRSSGFRSSPSAGSSSSDQRTSRTGILGLGENRDLYKRYEIEKIAAKIPHEIPSMTANPHILSLRYSVLQEYNRLVEETMVSYSDQKSSSNSFYYYRSRDSTASQLWNISLSSKSKHENFYMQQIICPAFSMNTSSKFKFINQLFMCEEKDSIHLKTLDFNRFEQQQFMDKFANPNARNSHARPLFIQFIDQVDILSLSSLKVHRNSPFKVRLNGENAADVGGPGREIFSSLILEMMNDHIGIFTFNPNRRNKVADTNQEDLIPNKVFNESYFFQFENGYRFYRRFVYAGSLIAVCIVSNLPQPMLLSSFIWEYLTYGSVSIESIYQIDSNFENIIKTAENLQKEIIENNLSEDEFESRFSRSFEVNDSFGKVVELIPSGSKITVTIEKLNEFIESAKNFRIHEFDQQLKDLKEGFDTVMCYKNITRILNPAELKLLVCGEPECNVDQMRKLTKVQIEGSQKGVADYASKMEQMFWNVMESFSVEERMLFIRFSTGSLGLPAPGLRWEKDLTVKIYTKEETDRTGDNLAKAHTCFSEVDIPYFENESELAKILRICIRYAGLITESAENPEVISEFS